MKKRPLICVVTADCTSQFLCDTLSGIVRQSQLCNCDIAILAPLTHFCFSLKPTHREMEREIYKLIESDDFDGYIYCKSKSSMNKQTMKYIESLMNKTHKNVMVVDGNADNRFDFTQSDDFDDFKSIVDHLIEVHGYKRIHCLTGIKGMFQSEERLKGYFASMKNHGINFDKSYYDYGDFWKDYPREYARRIISGELPKPEAIACGNDAMAYTLIETLESNGIHVPSDIAVTGYDGWAMEKNQGIALTTFRRDNFQLGADCMRRIHRQITGRLSNRAVSRKNGFIEGYSCGCKTLPSVSSRVRRQEKMYYTYKEHMDYSDMVFDLSDQPDIKSMIERVNFHSYMIYDVKYFNIFLSEEYLNSLNGSTASAFSLDLEMNLKPVLMKSDRHKVSFEGESFKAGSIASYFGAEREKPNAFYISPIHAGDKFFGIAALSYGKKLLHYDTTYMYFMKNFEAALDRLLVTSEYQYKLKKIYYNMDSEVLNMNGLYEWILRQDKEREMYFVCCELTDVKLLYGKYGGKKAMRMIENSVRKLSEELKDNERCGILTDNKIGAILNSPERKSMIFKKMRMSGIGDRSVFSFTLGECVFKAERILEMEDIFDLIGEAINCTVFTYKPSNNGSKQLYEKFVKLRKKLEISPEKEWNIDKMCEELSISRSTLQKNYKEFFGKSIIEELIIFRVEKAKSLLRETTFPISEISEICGYSSDTYFIKQFKKVENITPNEYREEHFRANK